jgi:DNA polymerase-3 subunit beta
VLRLTGAFPEFQNVIPRKCSNVVEFNRALLEANVRRALVLTDELNPAIKVAFEGMRATIESEATGVGSVRTTMDVDLSGPGGRIIFNPHFLIDALRVVETDQVRFEFEDASSPGKFVLGEEYLYVVMPITGV